MRRRLPALALVTVSLLAVLATPSQASTAPPPGSLVTGADASWPNCPTGLGVPDRRTLGLPLPLADARFVVLGLTNGYGFTANPCLASQVVWGRARHLWLGAYANTGYPSDAELQRYGGTGTLVQRLVRTGRAQAASALASMRAAGLAAPMIWLDIEPNSARPWSVNTAANNAVIDGLYSGYREAGLLVGIYSYASGWQQITGRRQTPGLPAWVPAGRTDRATALTRCSGSFNGGPVWIAQWTDGVRDFDVTCPGMTGYAQPHWLAGYLPTVLREGSTGIAVKALQLALGMPATGVFGATTTVQVRRFQAARQLTVDGVVGPHTWRALGAATTKPGGTSIFPLAFAST